MWLPCDYIPRLPSYLLLTRMLCDLCVFVVHAPVPRLHADHGDAPSRSSASRASGAR